jgi:acetyl esterase/lipase
MNVVLLALLLGQQNPRLRGLEVTRDIAYANTGNDSHTLDLYRKEGDDDISPLIIFIHGGGWRNGSKQPPREPLLQLAREGYSCASIEYRLTNEAKWPAQLHDCKATVRFLRANAEKFGFDPNKIGVWGTSAGGHLAAMLGLTGTRKDLEGDLGNAEFSSAVQAVVNCYGPADLQKQVLDRILKDDRRFKGNDPERALFEDIQSPFDVLRNASPIYFVAPDQPPFLMIHGDQDPLVPLDQSEMLLKRLKAAGNEASLIVQKGAGHTLRPEHHPDLKEFFKKHLGGPKQLGRVLPHGLSRLRH